MMHAQKAESDQSLLNMFEIEIDGNHRHLVCFLKPEIAVARGIDAQAIIGEFTPGPDMQFDVRTFALNPSFIDGFVGYMNHAATSSPTLAAEATLNPSGYLYLLDPRFQGEDGQEPPVGEVVGAYHVDANGVIIPDSFRYNEKHLLFDPTSGVSALLYDSRFYDWLHTRDQV